MVKKLESVQRSSKAYRSLLKIFLNDKKIPIIPPPYQKYEFLKDCFKKLNFLIPSFGTSVV